MAVLNCFTLDQLVKSGTLTIVQDLSDFYDCVTIDPCCECDNCFRDIMPYIATDVFYYNFNFDIEKIELIDIATGAVLADKTATWKTGNKQIKVDGSDTSGNDCFAVRINDDCCLCTAYQLDPCPADSMLIEGIYANGDKDCGGNLYNGFYSNRMRIKGKLLYTNHNKEVETDEDGNVKSVKNTNIDTLEFYTKFHNRGFSILHLNEVILNGNPINITLFDGTVYEYDYFSNSVTKQSDSKSDYWYPIIELTQLRQCEINTEC